MPSELEDAIERHRAALLRRERAAASQMVRVYGESWQRLRREIMRIDAREAFGGRPLTEQERLLDEHRRLIRPQIEAELRRFASYAADSVRTEQGAAIEAAIANTDEAIRAARPPMQSVFSKLNPRAVESLVGAASDGSPLRRLFEGIQAGIADDMTATLAKGVALGWNPRFTARELRNVYGVGLTRALVIARTETLRAYNEAAHQNFLNHSDVLDGWVWVAAQQRRTCASCWAMHGSVHPLSERLDDHPCGRCTKAPLVKGRETPFRRTGGEIFVTLSRDDQRHILGHGMYEAWSDGAVTLTPTGQRSIVGRRHDPEWGSMRYARSLRAILGADEADRYIGLARIR